MTADTLHPHAQPEATEAAFYAAFGKLDVLSMRRLWWVSDRISCIHPGGKLLQGYDAVMNSWEEIFRAHKPPTVGYRLIQATHDQNLVVHIVEERVKSGDSDRQAVVLATNIYTLVDGSWRMLAHHASLPLVDPKPEPAPPLH